MKLLRFRDDNFIKPGILDDTGKIRDISSLIKDWTGKTINDEIINTAKDYNTDNLPLVSDSVSLAPCVGEVGKFICIGLNYSDHAA